VCEKGGTKMSKIRQPGYYRVRKQNTWYFAAWSDVAWHVMADEEEIIFDSYWDEIIETPISPEPAIIYDEDYDPLETINLLIPEMTTEELGDRLREYVLRNNELKQALAECSVIPMSGRTERFEE
jgi:hypothetical protein